MANPSPTCLINSLTAPQNVTAGSTVTLALASTAGVQFWSIACSSTDETNTAAAINATLTVNMGAKTATFTAPASGSAVILKSTVGISGLGLDANGVSQPSFTTTFAVHVLTIAGFQVTAANETTEGNATVGWNAKNNAAIRSTSTLNVKTYGATGNGTTDDTTAIQSAINAASALVTAGMAGVAVYFPTGKYKLTAGVTLGPHIRYFGDSGGNSVIWQTNLQVNAGGTVILNSYYAFAFANGGGDQDGLIEHLTFLGENGVNGSGFVQPTIGVQTSYAIYLAAGNKNIEVRYCKFLQLWGNLCGGLGNGSYTRFHHNTGFQCGGEVNINDAYSQVCDNRLDTIWAIECASERIIVSRNHMINCDSGISIGGDGGYQAYVPDGALGTIIGATNATPIVIQTAIPHSCGSAQAPVALKIAGALGNTSANGTWQANVVDGTHLSLIGSAGNGAWTSGGTLSLYGDFGCQVTDNIIDITRAGSGISIGGPVFGCIVARNSIQRTASGYHGIVLSQAPFCRGPIGCKVEDNSIHQISAGQGILVALGRDHSIRRNKITNSSIAGSAMQYGILIQNFGGDIDSLDVTDNSVSGATSADICYQLGPTNVRHERNRFGTFNADASAPYTTFINDKVGQVTVSGATTTGSVTFMGIVNQPFPSTAYQVTLTPVGSTGTPAAGSNRVLSVTKAAASITVTVEVAPGAGNSVVFDYVCRWTP